MKINSLRGWFFVLTALTTVLLLGLLAAILNLSGLGNQISTAHSIRYHSYLLADELRQSSDDLTRLARTYVVTGDPKWEQQYFDVLAIRNGTKPRPEFPNRIVWDFEAANQPVRRSNNSVALRQLMRDAGFTDAEFNLLNQAEANSNQLVYTETVAMNAVKGLFEDASGKFSQTGEPNPSMAIEMMHNQAYHNEKARIMVPINDFLGKLDERTFQAKEEIQQRARQWLNVIIALTLLSLLVLPAFTVVIRRYVQSLLGAEPAELNQIANQLASGDLQPVLAKSRSAVGVFSFLSKLSAQLIQQIRAVSTNATALASVAEQLSSAATQLQVGTQSQSQGILLISTASEEMSHTAKDIAHNVNSVQERVADTLTLAKQGGQTVAGSSKSMQGISTRVEQAASQASELSQKAQEVHGVVGIISSIAEQTNLLALNAAIEAARAGEAGRGFAVVADEVRSLAERSAKSTVEINSIISSMQTGVEAVVTVMRLANEEANDGMKKSADAASSFEQIVSAMSDLSGLVAQNAASIDEMSSTSAQVNHDIQAVQTVANETRTAGKAMAVASETLMASASELSQNVTYFKLPR